MKKMKFGHTSTSIKQIARTKSLRNKAQLNVIAPNKQTKKKKIT